MSNTCTDNLILETAVEVNIQVEGTEPKDFSTVLHFTKWNPSLATHNRHILRTFVFDYLNRPFQGNGTSWNHASECDSTEKYLD